MPDAPPDLRAIGREQLEIQLGLWGEPAYRAGQILAWIYEARVSSWDAMTNLPRGLRERLAETYRFAPFPLVRKQGASDTTQKFLWRLPDGSLIESVLIPANPALYGDASDRNTLCVSTQVGCAYGCRFCASGLEGWKRNLEIEEIVEQVLGVERQAAAPGSRGERVINNLVIMGMGEPLANYDRLLPALKILNAPWGGNLGARKITISTSGLVPQIRRLADEPFQFRLAISLHGATDATRDRIMPVNRKYPLAALVPACEYYQQQKHGMITLEYILIAGVNDGRAEIKPLADLARRLHAKINLIPYNQVPGLPWQRPEESIQEAFLAGLRGEKVRVTLRREKGHDIDAACGQLRLRTEQSERELRLASS